MISRYASQPAPLWRTAIHWAALGLLLCAGPGLAEDQRPAPDPRWSLVYQLDGLRDAPAPADVTPVEHHSSFVQPRSLRAQDSPDVAVMPSSTVTQSEISTFVDPNDPNTVFVSTNTTDWNGSTVVNLYGTGVYWTFDGGATWSGNDQGPGGVGNSGDPAAVIRGIDGRWVVGYISDGFGQGVSFTDNQGATWSHVTLFSSGTLDKNHLMVDNVPTSAHYGNLYSAWSNLGGGANLDNIELVTSTSGGATWSGVTNISAGVNAGSHDQGINVQVGPNGEVYAVWAIYDSWPSDETALGFNSSTDGGTTWTGEYRAITNILGHRSTALPNTSIRKSSFPSMAVDVSGGPNDGNIYVVWTNQGVPGVNTGDVDVYLARSTDGGSSFETPVRVNQDTTNNAQWFPWISCDPATGILTVIFYDRRDDPADTQTRAYMAVSNDGGQTWEDFAVSDVSFVPAPISGLAGGYMGDYLGIAVGSGKAYPSWCDNRTGNVLTYVSPILVADPDDPNPPTSTTAFSDYTTPASVQLDWTDAATYADGTPLGDFSVDVLRDDVLLINVDQGTETYFDGGRTDGQSYIYTLRTRDDVTDSLSVAVNLSVYAGGSPFPAAPSGVGCAGDSVSATVTWTNPTTQDDGTTLDDFAGVRIFRDDTLLIELARAPGDTGSADSYVDSPPIGFVYTYAVAAIDSEAPVNESARTAGPACFVGSVPNILVWQPTDVPGTAGTVIFNTLSGLGESAYFTDDLFEFSPNLNAHEIVCAVIGIYSNNHIISASEGAALDSFVQNGGRLYLEGSDCFNYDPESAGGYQIRPMFGLSDGSDGSADLGGVTGINDLVGFSFTYSGANNYIDELVPTTSTAIFQNDSNSDLVTVFKPDYFLGRSIGASFEFAGLDDQGASLVPVSGSIDLAAHWVHSPFFYEGPELPRGANPMKEAARVPADERGPRPELPRAANTETWVRPAAWPQVTGGLDALVAAARRANTKSDLMAVYLTLLRSTGAPVMVVSEDSLFSALLQNDTDTQFFSVSNPGTLNDQLIYTITESPEVGWLSVSPAADTLGASGVQQITVDFDATGLAPGVFTTDLVLDGNDPVTPSDTVAVTMTVLGSPEITVTPDSLYFFLPLLATQDDSVTITNTGLGDLDYSLGLTGSGGAQRTEFPSTAVPGTASSRFRGNVYQVDSGVPLKQIDQYLNVSSPTQLEFFVYESPAASGTFTKIFSQTVTSGTGEGWHSSGSMDVPLEAGKFYFIGCGWLGTVTYYHDNGTTGVPAPVPFGFVLSPGGSNSYPPPVTQSISGTGSSIWSQAVEVGTPANVTLLSPSTGNIPPTGSATVQLRADGGPDPGVFYAQLNISHNAPGVGTVQVPITIEAYDPVDAPNVAAPLPSRLALHATAPNPFRRETTIRYDLPQAQHVRLTVYDVTGRLVRMLRDRTEEAGFRSVVWDGRDAGGQRVGAGVYFYALEAGEDVFRKKMVILR